MSFVDTLKNILRATKLPAISANNDAQAVKAMKEILEVFQGQRGSPLDRVVTVRDLVDAGVVVYRHKGQAINGSVGGMPNIAQYDRAPPPAITGLAATGGLGTVFLIWDWPGYSNYAHTELWRSATDDLGTAVRVGTSVAAVYADSVGDGDTYYYWARAVTIANVPGPFNAVSGVEGKPAHDPAYVMSLLTVKWKASTAYAAGKYVIPTPSKETGLWYKATTGGTSGTTEPTWPTQVGQTVGDGTVTWQAIAAGSEIPPFIVGEVDGIPAVCINGNLFVDGTIVGRMIAVDAVTASHINVVNLAAISANLGAITGGSLNINNKFIVSPAGYVEVINGDLAGNYSPGVSGWALFSDGSAELNNGTFRGTLQTDEIYDNTYNLPGVFVKQIKITNPYTAGLRNILTGNAGLLTVYVNYTVATTPPRFYTLTPVGNWYVDHDGTQYRLYLNGTGYGATAQAVYVTALFNSVEASGWDGTI